MNKSKMKQNTIAQSNKVKCKIIQTIKRMHKTKKQDVPGYPFPHGFTALGTNDSQAHITKRILPYILRKNNNKTELPRLGISNLCVQQNILLKTFRTCISI